MRSSPFRKTKVTNQKTVSQNLKGFNATATFVKAVTTLWDSRNVKSKDTRFLLNEENGKPCKSADDKRLKSILQLAKKI